MDSWPQSIVTRSAHIQLRSEGIVEVTCFPAIRQSLEDAKENIAGAITVSGGKIRPLLVDIRRTEPVSPEARRHLASDALNNHFAAFALLLKENALGLMMGNVYFKLAKHTVPKRLFMDESGAVAWLVKFQ